MRNALHAPLWTIAVVVALAAPALSQRPRWETDLDAALRQARSKRKPVLIYAYDRV